jgi:trimeric autotransporter adhesin
MATINAVNNSTFTSATAITVTSGNLTLTSGNLVLPNSSSTVGQIQWNSTPYIHNYTTRNIFIGQSAGNFTNTSSDNTGIGYQALKAITTGSSGAGQNSACGSGALASLTSGFNNTAVGFNCMNLATTGNQNHAFGSLALSALTTGSSNTVMGYNAAINYTGSESSNVIIMHAGVAAESNVMRLGTDGTGTGQQSTCFVAGILNSTVTGSAVLISSTFQLGLVASSKRYKENIQDMGDTPLMKLRPVTFNYNFGTEEDKSKKQYGLIAEEVLEVMPELVAYNSSGQVHTVHYHLLPALLLNELQKQQKIIESLESLIAELESKNVKSK